MRKIEILAPAGSYESMRAAMNAGCDAVYMGGSRFGARAYADNPDADTLIKAIEDAHLRNKRLYLTVNTLVKEDEKKDLLYDYLERYYLAGLDAVIVQDVGVMHFIHEHFPKLPIHASTQTTITMAQGANLLKDVGVTRLVTARELSFKEIKYISDNTDMEIETFVHGALCYCYSGQCLMSSMIGGRSGNRGRCAQPCRMPFEFFSEGKRISSEHENYLLSPKDINTIAYIPDLIEAGVSSFKIEGRMKSPEYAAGVTYAYRKYVDIYLYNGKEYFLNYLESNEYTKDMLDLMDLYNRGGFSQGYGKTYNGKSMMSMIRPNHSGVPIGEVIGATKGLADIRLNEDVNAQDILEIRNRDNKPVYEFTLKDGAKAKEVIRSRVGFVPYKNKNRNREHNEPVDKLNVSIGDIVYRTRNNALLNKIRDQYIKTHAKYNIIGHLYAKKGERLQLTLSYNNESVTAYHNPVEAAIKQPMTEDKLRASIDKLGDTLFQFDELIIEAENDIFVPVAWLNEIRREAVDMIIETLIKSYHRSKMDISGPSINQFDNNINSDINSDIYGEDTNSNNASNADDYEQDSLVNISVAISTQEQFDTAISYTEIKDIYVEYENFTLKQIIDMSRTAWDTGKECFIVLPHICRYSLYEKMKKEMATLSEHDEVSGFIIKNFEEADMLLDIQESVGKKKKLRLNHNMYIFNQDAKRFWRNKGINQFSAPVELNEKELRDLELHDCQLMVYGYLPVMVSVQCLHASSKTCNRCKDGTKRIDYIIDRIGKKFYVKTNCNNCYNVIYNGQRLSLLGQANKIKDIKPKGIRLDFTHETQDEIKKVLDAYCSAFIYGRSASLDFDNMTNGHFKRGVE